MLGLSVVVLWVSIQGHLTNFVERIIGVWPDLGDIENVESVVSSVLLWHQLDVPGPGWEILLLDFAVKIRG